MLRQMPFELSTRPVSIPVSINLVSKHASKEHGIHENGKKSKGQLNKLAGFRQPSPLDWAA